MNNHLKMVVITIIMMVCSIGRIHSQTTQARFRHLTAKDGFTSATVNTIYKDSQGFIWLGAFDGLYRYDGYEFKAYKHDPANPTSLSNNPISNIFEDEDEVLWIGSMWSGLNKYDRTEDKFKRYYPNPDTSSRDVNGILCIFQDKVGTLWVSTPTGGLHQYIDSADSFLSYKYDTIDTENYKNFVQCIYEDSKGNFWTGTRKGLFKFDRKEKKYYEPEFLRNVNGVYYFNRDNEYIVFEDHIITGNVFQRCRYNDILEDKKGIYWFATTIGLLKYDPNLNKLTYFESQVGDPASLSVNRINKIVEEPGADNNTLWLSTYWGLNQFNKETGYNKRYLHDPINPQSLPYSVIHGLYLDDGLLWIGNENSGVSLLNRLNTHFEYYQLESKQDKERLITATSFCVDRNGFTWVGTNKGGLFKYDQKMNLVDHYNFPHSNLINSIHETDDGLLIVGTYYGLFIYDRIGNEFKHCTLINDGSPLQSAARINAIFKDSFDWNWVGIGGIPQKGLFYQKPESKGTTNFYQITQYPLDHTDIRDFYEDKNKVLWVATNGGGIYLLKPENRDSLYFQKFEEEGAIPLLLNTLTIFADHNGFLWFGGFNGLTRYSPKDGSIKHFSSGNGLEVDAVYDIEGDGRYLWLSSDKGLLRFDPISAQETKVKIIQLSDGIPFEDIYTYDIYRSKEGMIHAGGKRGSENGFFRFHPDNMKENQHIPPVVITRFQVNNKPFPLDSNIIEKKHLILKYNQNHFSFEFAALDYLNPEGNQYAYKLDGIDNDWVQSANRRFVNYTGVNPGNYLFRVRGSNNDGIWNEEGTSVLITILPPPWKTWWAYTIYGIIGVSFLIFMRLYDLKRQRLKKTLELEKVEKEKLDELDKMKSRFFANISHEFRTPLTLILGPIEKAMKKAKNKNIQNDLNIVLRNAKRLQSLINELLSLSKLESGKLKLHASKYDIIRFVKDYSHLFESMAKQRNIEIKFKSDEKEIPVYVDRDKLEKILNNLLSNAFKFTSDSGRIDIEIVQQISDVVINISDNGQGIPPDKIPFIFDRFYQADESINKGYEGTGIGLALTKELVELHNGKITARSDKEKGTTFSISFPLGRSHLNDGDIIPETTHEMATDLDAISMIEDLQETPPAGINEIPSELDPRPVVLVVEDNYDLMAYIRESLEETYQVLGANNGLKGLEKAVNFIPDLIVSDVMMPEMDGFILSKKIKSNEHTSHIPLILLTAKAGKEDKMIGLETGADDFITKPFDHDELLVRIKNLIVQRKKLTEHILKNISSDNPLSTSGVSSMEQKFLKKAINVVGHYISDSEFSVELFANEMSMSRVQLHRKLTALVGQPAGDFIRTVRLNKAAQLIKKNSGIVSEIAYDVGFSNPSYFAKCFQKQFGKLPSEYTD